MIRPNQLFHETIRLKVARNELASPLEGSYLLGRGPDLDIFAPQPAPDIYAPQPTPVEVFERRRALKREGSHLDYRRVLLVRRFSSARLTLRCANALMGQNAQRCRKVL